VTRRRLPAAATGYLRRSKELAAAAKAAGESTNPCVPVAQLRALGLRPNWERVKDFDPMEEDEPGVGLAAVLRTAMKQRGLTWNHMAVALGSRRGFPDLTIWGRGGIIFRELKGTKGKMTVAQLEIVLSLRAAGQDAAVWWPEDYHLGLIAAELDRVAGITDRRTRTSVWTPGLRKCGCPMDVDHTCVAWGGPTNILPR
jgi:hypothetical protein